MTFKGYIYINLTHPLVCWETYRGALISADQTEDLEEKHPSVWLAGKIRRQNNISLANELLFESIRVKSFVDKVSRLRGLYVFRDLDSAQQAQNWGGHFVFDNLVEVEVTTESDLTRVDANWLTYADLDNEGYIKENYIDNISKYWEGIPYNDNPCWEYLINGKAMIFGTRVRKKAYDNLKSTMPESLGLLELSRVALLLDSDLGHSIPWVQKIADDTFRLRYIINFADAKNAIFLDKLSKFDGAKNTADLNQLVNLVTPDLSRFETEFKISKTKLYEYSSMKIHVS